MVDFSHWLRTKAAAEEGPEGRSLLDAMARREFAYFQEPAIQSMWDRFDTIARRPVRARRSSADARVKTHPTGSIESWASAIFDAETLCLRVDDAAPELAGRLSSAKRLDRADKASGARTRRARRCAAAVRDARRWFGLITGQGSYLTRDCRKSGGAGAVLRFPHPGRAGDKSPARFLTSGAGAIGARMVGSQPLRIGDVTSIFVPGAAVAQITIAEAHGGGLQLLKRLAVGGKQFAHI